MSEMSSLAQLALQLETRESEEVTLQRPLAELIASALSSAGRSKATQRSYQNSYWPFFCNISMTNGVIPCPLILPPCGVHFAETTTEGKRTIWIVRPPSAVLRFVTAPLLDGFRAWRIATGDTTATATIRLYAVRTLLAIAHRDGVLTPEQARTMNIKVYVTKQTRQRQPVGRRLTPVEVSCASCERRYLDSEG